jgi:hypothetical protein
MVALSGRRSDDADIAVLAAEPHARMPTTGGAPTARPSPGRRRSQHCSTVHCCSRPTTPARITIASTCTTNRARRRRRSCRPSACRRSRRVSATSFTCRPMFICGSVATTRPCWRTRQRCQPISAMRRLRSPTLRTLPDTHCTTSTSFGHRPCGAASHSWRWTPRRRWRRPSPARPTCKSTLARASTCRPHPGSP